MEEMNNTDGKLVCDKCGKFFKTQKTLNQHQKRPKACRPSPVLKCPVCGKTFDRESDLRGHGYPERCSKQKPELEFPFVCPVSDCQRRYKSLDALRLHGRRIHGTEPVHKKKKLALEFEEANELEEPPCNEEVTNRYLLYIESFDTNLELEFDGEFNWRRECNGCLQSWKELGFDIGMAKGVTVICGKVTGTSTIENKGRSLFHVLRDARAVVSVIGSPTCEYIIESKSMEALPPLLRQQLQMPMLDGDSVYLIQFDRGLHQESFTWVNTQMGNIALNVPKMPVDLIIPNEFPNMVTQEYYLKMLTKVKSRKKPGFQPIEQATLIKMGYSGSIVVSMVKTTQIPYACFIDGDDEKIEDHHFLISARYEMPKELLGLIEPQIWKKELDELFIYLYIREIKNNSSTYSIVIRFSGAFPNPVM